MTYPTAAPQNYDGGQAIKVDPAEVGRQAKDIDKLVQEIIDHWKIIVDACDAVKLGWAGTTQAEVDQFNTQWHGAFLKMFGDPKADPKSTPPEGQSALGKVQQLVDGAAANYAFAEEALCGSYLTYFGGKFNTGDPLPDHAPPPADSKPTPPKDDPDYGKRDSPNAPISEKNGGKI